MVSIQTRDTPSIFYDIMAPLDRIFMKISMYRVLEPGVLVPRQVNSMFAPSPQNRTEC